ncbi:MAG: RNA polymerase sigma factor [Cyclobacteriaceae bacterium]
MDVTPYQKIKEKCEKVFKGKYGIFDEDVIYDTMASIIFQYQKNRTEIRNLNAWLLGAIHHHYCSYVANKTRERNTFHYDNFLSDQEHPDGDFAENKIDADIALSEIEQLEEPYRGIVKLRLIEGFSHKEIADEMDIKESTVRKYYSRSIKKIVSILKPVSQILILGYLMGIHT